MTPFGFNSTAEEVAKGQDLTGKVVLVTGGNSGIGKETARVLLLKGCHVIITSRQAEAAEEAIQEMHKMNAQVDKGDIAAEGQVSHVTLDLADLDSVKSGVVTILQHTRVVDYLVLNAGVMACPYTKTKNNLELQIGTNHFGHFVLTRDLIAGLEKPPGRVIVLTSKAQVNDIVQLEDLHYTKGRTYVPLNAYGQSKTANSLFAKELTRRAKGAYIAVSVHPGVIRTNLQRHLTGVIGMLFYLLGLVPAVFEMAIGEREKTLAQGAATTIWAMLSQDLKGGEYCADCQIKAPPQKQVDDEEIQKKLWEVTEQQLAKVNANNGQLAE